MSEQERKVVFSAVQPTGRLTIGNYIGALKNMASLTEDYDCFYAVADLHSLTIDIQPKTLRENTLNTLALFVASGLNPQKCTLFLQSQVPQHTELTWILNCNTMFGEARRMVQFKEKSAKSPKNVNVGLFDYPILQAADILLYQADLVPIGKDQKQHLELSKVIAERFNTKYSPTFKIPEVFYPKQGAKINSLANPEAKMGKSDENENGTVFLLDDRDTVIRKFKKAVTDSGNEIIFSPQKKGISNLITIYSAFTQRSVKQIESEFKGVSYAEFKLAVGEAVADGIGSIQSEYKKIIADKAYLNELMKSGREKASRAAFRTLRKVYKKVGLIDTL